MIGSLLRVIMLTQSSCERSSATDPRRSLPFRSARENFFEIVDEVAAQDRLPFHVAMAKVKAERPDIFDTAFPVRRPRHARQIGGRSSYEARIAA